ncbi:MAG: PKD domain-containing protein [Bacteroidales bacterium]
MKKTIFPLGLGILLFFSIINANAQIITFTVAGASNTYITCVNDSNVIAGYYENTSGVHGFIYDGVSPVFVNYPGAVQTFIYGINNDTVVVGAYNTTGSVVNNEGFSFDPETGIYTDLTTSWLSSADNTIARDINDTGCIVGDHKQGTTHVCFSMCLGYNSTFHYNYKPTYINSINNSGQRTGFWIEGSQRHGLIYNNGSWSQKDYPGATRTMFTALNDSNIAVGIFNLNRSFIYRNGLFKEVKKTGATDIQIHDINNKGKIVGYYKDAANIYKGFWMNIWDIYFRPNPNGWSFPNNQANIWPPSWYNQFNYSYDPYLGGESWFPQYTYPDGTLDTLDRSKFPDWPLFVNVVGEGNCYWFCWPFRTLSAGAVEKYFTMLGDWNGSCFGFVQSSYMVWDSIERFKAKFPKVGPWDASKELYQLPINDDNRMCINHLMTKQSQSHFYSFIGESEAITPTETLADVKRMLLDKSKNEQGLGILNQNKGGGGHIVNPYKVTVDETNTDIEYIHIYDNNFPNDTTRKIKIDKVLDCWYYNLSANAGLAAKEWGGNTANQGIFLVWPVREWYKPTILDSVAKTPAYLIPDTLGEIAVYPNVLCNIRIKDQFQQVTGYQGNEIVNTIPGAIPLIRQNSHKEPPYGYQIPQGAYTGELSNFAGNLSSLKVFYSNSMYNYWRSDVDLTHMDVFSLDNNGLTITNQQPFAKTINLGDIFKDIGSEMQIKINKIGQSAMGSTTIKTLNDNKVKLNNSGNYTTYDLQLHLAGNTGESRFQHDSIPISANTSHIISPNWDSLSSANLIIYVDNGNNGTYEDTLFFGNDHPPQFLTYPTLLKKSKDASVDTVYITNNGGGNLNWSVISDVPSWAMITGSNSGNNLGYILVSISQNTGSTRSGKLTLSAAGAINSPYTIDILQEGIMNPPATVTASDGTSSAGVALSWSGVPGATHYKVFRSENAGDNGSDISDWITAISFTDSSALKGQFYYYSVICAQDSFGLNTTDFSVKDLGWRSCFTALFEYNGECMGQATIFSNNSTNHTEVTYHWDINNDGQTDYFGRNIEHTYTVPGTYIVKLIVSDSIQCTDSITQTVVIKDFPIITLISDSSLCSDQSITLDAGTGFDSYLWSTGETTPSITVDSSGFGLGLHGIYVKVTNGNGCSALASTRISWDSCGIAGGFTLQGQLSYDNSTSSPLSSCLVSLLQGEDTVYQTATNSDGEYSFTNIPAGNYYLTASCSKAWGGVNAIDALLVIRHFVGISTLTGVRLVAADVNANNTINSIDALMIARRFVGIDTLFEAGDWAIERDTLSIGDSPTQIENLKAVTYGDVDGSYLPTLKSAIVLSLEPTEYRISDITQVISIPLKICSPEEIGAIALIINIPATTFDLKEVTTTYEGTLLYNYNDGQLRIAWYSLTPMKLNSGDVIFNLYGRMLSTELETSGWTLDPYSQITNSSGEVLSGITLTLPKFRVDNTRFLLMQNSPNPFTDGTEISWVLPESAHVLLRIFDQAGNEIRTLVNSGFGAGIYTTEFSAKGLNPGVYTYSIEVRTKDLQWTDSKQLVILR